MRQRGQFAIEFTLACALLALALLARGPSGDSVVALWLSAWQQFVHSARAWLAYY
jgi:hypothetical protein